MKCKNCNHDFVGDYCQACGQKSADRITLKYLGNLIMEDIFSVDRGLLYTIKQLWINPGKTARDFIEGKRKSYYGPIKYLILWTAIYFIGSSLLAHERKINSIFDLVFNTHTPFSSESFEDFVGIYMEALLRHTDLFYLGAVPFFTLISYVLYRKQGLFFTELSIPYLYLSGQIVFVTVVTLSLITIFGTRPMVAILSLTVLVFVFFVLKLHKQFFQESWPKTVLKSLTVIYVGQFVYGIAAYIVVNVLKLLY